MSHTEVQLRCYRVRPGQLERFIEQWREQIVPLRRRHGFDVLGAWSSDAESRFVWLVGVQGKPKLSARETAYYADPDRNAMNPDPAQHLLEIETVMLRPILLD